VDMALASGLWSCSGRMIAGRRAQPCHASPDQETADRQPRSWNGAMMTTPPTRKAERISRPLITLSTKPDLVATGNGQMN